MDKIIWNAWPVQGGHIVQVQSGNYRAMHGLPTGDSLADVAEVLNAEIAELLAGRPPVRASVSLSRGAVHEGGSAGAREGHLAEGAGGVKHTPGPWTYSIDLNSDGSGDHFKLSATSSDAFLWSCGCCEGINIDGPNAKANADLIAAAADLLAALEAYMYWASKPAGGAGFEPVERARAAIARARGEA